MAGGTGAFQAGQMNDGLLIDILAAGLKSGLANPLVINSTAVVYSNTIRLPRGCTFGWELKFTSSGVCTVTVELEQANQPPNTEGAQDDAFIIPGNKATTNGLFPTGVITAVGRYQTAYSPNATILARLKITGTGSNDASTALTVARVYAIKNT